MTMNGFNLDRLGGLTPEAWICVGPGFSREEVKSVLLAQGRGFVGEAVTTLIELCLRLTKAESSCLLSPTARQEILRMLLSEPRISEQMPELKRFRRRRRFYSRLDSAIQLGRMSFAHEDEESVYEERLRQSRGPNPLRMEVRALAQAYEVWIQSASSAERSHGWIDPPLLLRRAIQILNQGWPEELERPEVIWTVSVQVRESLEKEFWDQVRRHVAVESLSLSADALAQTLPLHWHRWHTVDDAAEFVAAEVRMTDVILIPDLPAIRRSLKRALDRRGVPLAEPRDPTFLRWSEGVKSALLPLEVVGGNFERAKVLAWLRTLGTPDAEANRPRWTAEINARGIRHGLASYFGEPLEEVFRQLKSLQDEWGGRRTCAEFAEKHLKMWETPPAIPGTESTSFWGLGEFFRQFWQSWVEDLEKVSLGDLRAPLFFWLEKIQTRLYEATPPVQSIKPRQGVQIHRLQQASFLPYVSSSSPPSLLVASSEAEAPSSVGGARVWVLGMPSRWLHGDGMGDYWFTEREREVLSAEFSVRSNFQVQEERTQILKSWLYGASQVTFLDFQYGRDGQERESSQAVFRELERSLNRKFPDFPEERGSHPRFLKSYDAVLPVQPRCVQLPARPDRPILAATALERYSRCSFQALGYHRWNLRDIREPDIELWPDVRGTILHEAVRVLLKSLDPGGNFTMSPAEALNRAWVVKPPKGLIRSVRIENYVKSRMIKILGTFCSLERLYLQKSGARPASIEDSRFRLDYPGFSIVGQPDRIDEHPEGLFVIDYKTSGSVPHGLEMVDRGYRVQLPFYAVAVQRQKSRPVLGVQFVELDRRGGRKSGIFFKEYNGKEEGKLTQVRSNSKSLVSADPAEVWSKLESWFVQYAQGFVQGKFEATPNTPKREKECHGCRLGDLCGERRRVDSNEF